MVEGEGSEQHAVDDAEHHRGATDTEREDDHRRHRERRSRAQSPDGETRLAPRGIQPRRADVANRFLRLRDPAQAEDGQPSSLFRRDAPRNVGLGFLI